MESSAPAFNVNGTLGALQIGVLVSYMLFGITTTQAYIYYGRFPEDSRRLKCFVAFVCLCELAYAIFLGWGLYTSTITNYGKPEFQSTGLSFDVSVFFSGLISTSVRLFFSYRAYALSHKLIVPLILGTLSVLYFTGVTAIFVDGFQPKETIPTVETQWSWAFFASWSVGIAADVGIALTLVFMLVRNRTNGLQRTAALVDKLIIWTIETGLLTSLFTILILICFLTMKENFIWIGLFTVESRLFANSFLASLNSRTTLRALNDASLPISMPVMNTTPHVEITRVTLSQADPNAFVSIEAKK